MNATFDINGYELDVTSNGILTSRDGKMGCGGSGVGLQLTRRPISIGEGGIVGTGEPESVMQTFVTHSQARAIASAILSAATESR